MRAASIVCQQSLTLDHDSLQHVVCSAVAQMMMLQHEVTHGRYAFLSDE